MLQDQYGKKLVSIWGQTVTPVIPYALTETDNTFNL